MEMGPDSLWHSHWSARTQLCPDRPHSKAQSLIGSFSSPPRPHRRIPMPRFPPFVLVPSSELLFLSWRCPRGRGSGTAQACRHAALRFCNCGMSWLLLPVPGTLAWPVALTAHLSPGGTRVLRSADAWGSSRGWLHPDVLCALSEPEFSLLLKETSEREGATEAMEILKGAVVPPRGY